MLLSIQYGSYYMAGNFKNFFVSQFGFSPNGTKELLLTAVLHKYCDR